MCVHTHSAPSQDGPGEPPAYLSRTDVFGLHCRQPGGHGNRRRHEGDRAAGSRVGAGSRPEEAPEAPGGIQWLSRSFGEGTTLDVDDGASSAFVAVEDVTQITPPSEAQIEVERNRLSATTIVERAFSSRKDPGELVFTYECGLEKFQRVEDLKGADFSYRLTWPDDLRLVFSGTRFDERPPGGTGRADHVGHLYRAAHVPPHCLRRHPHDDPHFPRPLARQREHPSGAYTLAGSGISVHLRRLTLGDRLRVLALADDRTRPAVSDRPICSRSSSATRRIHVCSRTATARFSTCRWVPTPDAVIAAALDANGLGPTLKKSRKPASATTQN